MTKMEKLERLHNRSTRYEVAMIQPSGERILIGYTSRKSRHGLLERLRTQGPQIIAFLGLDDNAAMVPGKNAAAGFRIGETVFRFTGRTQRDAIMENELRFIGAAA